MVNNLYIFSGYEDTQIGSDVSFIILLPAMLALNWQPDMNHTSY